MKKLILPAAILLCSPSAWASTSYGALSNFDVVNDTGETCYGFEIEIEDAHSTDVGYTYDYNHYGAPKIREDLTNPAHPKTFVRYEGAIGSASAFTNAALPGSIAPTDGHQCTNPGVNLGCEHFGVGYYGSGLVRYFWLVQDPANPGNLARGPVVNVAAPVWTYIPPVVPADPGLPIIPAQVQAVIAAPEPPEIIVKEFGDAVWVKEIRTQSHNHNKVKLEELVSDDPADPNDKNWANGEPDEVEVEWEIKQTEFAKADGGPNGKMAGAPEPLENGDEIITRRYEFYKYIGPFDAETNEALCDSWKDVWTPAQLDKLKAECKDADGQALPLIGDYIGAQMVGFDAAAPLGLINQIQDGDVSEAYPDRSVVQGGNTPYATKLLAGKLPDGLNIDSASGVLSGAPSKKGRYNFTLEATDLDGTKVNKAYSVNIVGPVQAIPGDFDSDEDVDRNDVNLLKARYGQNVAPGDPADLNGDGRINVLDFVKETTLCTRPRCAIN